MKPEFLKEPYEVIEAKLELAELTLDLGNVTHEKWIQLEKMKEILAKEENLLKILADKSISLRALIAEKVKP